MRDKAATTDEIEITEEMVAAGVRILALFDYEFESYQSAVSRIYEAMVDAKPAGTRGF